MMSPSEIIALVSCAIALIAVCVSAWGTSRAAKAPLTSTYFSTMVTYYAAYINCVGRFVYSPTLENRDALSFALHKLLLFAGKEVCNVAQELYLVVLDWAQGPKQGALVVDEKLNQLGILMRRELYQFQRKGGL